jgi:hypothetical protein
LESAGQLALKEARSVLSHDIKDGRIDLKYGINIEDDQGKVVHSLPLGDAFVIAECSLDDVVTGAMAAVIASEVGETFIFTVAPGRTSVMRGGKTAAQKCCTMSA